MKKSKKLVIFIAFILVSAICFTAGFSVGKIQEEDVSEISTKSPEQISTETTAKYTPTRTRTTASTEDENKSSETIETAYYNITIPASWYGNYSHRVLTYSADGSYSLYFRHDKSYAESSGGHLFTIELHTVESNYAEKLQQFSPTPFDYLGILSIPDKGDFQVIVTYSSDVQYADRYEEEYNNIRNTVDNALITIKGTNGARYETAI